MIAYVSRERTAIVEFAQGIAPTTFERTNKIAQTAILIVSGNATMVVKEDDGNIVLPREANQWRTSCY